MVFLRYWNAWLHKTCWGIHSVQVVQAQWEPQVELWVAGARGKKPGSFADPLHNKGHADLWSCQGTRDTAGAQDSAGRPQTMARMRLGGCKSPGDPWGSLPWGTSLGCYSGVAPRKNYLEGPEVWDSAVGNLDRAGKEILADCVRVERGKPAVKRLWSQQCNSGGQSVTATVAPGLSDRKVS